MTDGSQMTNVVFDEIEIGRSASSTRTLSQGDIDLLALVSGDVDPFHVGGDVRDKHTIEAAAAVAFVAGVLGTQLPGPGMTIRHSHLNYAGRISLGDTLTASVTARIKRSDEHEVEFDCRCVNQSGEELIQGMVTVRAPTRRLAYTDVVPPELILRRGDAFHHLFDACEPLAPVRCAVVYPCDRASLLGPIEAARRKLINPILVGPEDQIRAVAQSEGIDLSDYRLEPASDGRAAAARAVAMAREGGVDALMKGSLHTDELLSAVVPSATGLRTSRRISHVFVMDVPTYPRMLLITDVAVNIYPKLKEKADIVQNAIDLARILGVTTPRVAILSAVETVNPEIESTLEAAALCKMADRGQITGGILDGPLAFDNAISVAAARTKKIESPVAGQADILLVPDLEAGNMLAKQLFYLAGAEGAGIVLGARVPIVLTSRSDSVRTRLASTAVMALVAHAQSTGQFPVT